MKTEARPSQYHIVAYRNRRTERGNDVTRPPAEETTCFSDVQPKRSTAWLYHVFHANNTSTGLRNTLVIWSRLALSSPVVTSHVHETSLLLLHDHRCPGDQPVSLVGQVPIFHLQSLSTHPHNHRISAFPRWVRLHKATRWFTSWTWGFKAK